MRDCGKFILRYVKSDTVVLGPDCSPRCAVTAPLVRQDIDDHYSVIRELGTGTYGRVLHVRCRLTGARVALKVVHKRATKLQDFLREFNLTYYLSAHRSIVSTYDVAFETPTAYVFAQECAPCGDLFEAITPQIGLPESQVKRVARQMMSALEFVHSKCIVHRDIKPENVLLFDEQFTKVKLVDFGMSKRTGTLVRKVSDGIPYTAPEISATSKGGRYAVDCASDVWAFGVLLYCTLTGNFPWEFANNGDEFFREFCTWHARKSIEVPSQWKRLSSRLMSLFRKMLEIKPERRCSVTEVYKYLEDPWIVAPASVIEESEVDHQEEKIEGNERPTTEKAGRRSKSRHREDGGQTNSDNDTLERHYAIETKLSEQLRDQRIRQWLLST